ncbi:MAG: dTDP-4-amino-4,6-dideoxygalactose transaminase [Spirochaetae bacterium HGW-Spirochaetae-1]|jgi:dTDP-4-amino-4,6-dideoxygalactose transaminase|nr:MAG: dTDP-4-amino-4,6-dideoxygalactose transaminase [Spirochaetae bacterium HGW-Spirochaetae-1]
MIPFNKPCVTGKEEQYLKKVIENGIFAGDNEFTKKCHAWFDNVFPGSRSLMTPSATHALDMSCILIDLRPGDEVIVPSFTFPATATCATMRGATPVFVDIRPDTLNINENLIEEAITGRTRAILPVHYAGVGCEMEAIMDIARRHNLPIIEDSAQAILCSYKGKPLGTFGLFGCFSFHETKNLQCGEGGAMIINDPAYFERAEILREKGTNRSKFWRGEIDKYSWVDTGSSYIPSELTSAFLYAQLEQAETIMKDRLKSWDLYYKGLTPLEDKGHIELPRIPEHCKHNGHIFYIKVRDLKERDAIIKFLREKGIYSVFHYVPLHSSQAGRKYGRMHGEDCYTTKESDRLVRLPMYYQLTNEEIHKVIDNVQSFFA